MFKQSTRSDRKEYMRIYHKNRWINPKKRKMDLIQHKKYYNSNKDKFKIYYLVNKETITRRKAEWYKHKILKNPHYCKDCNKLIDWKTITNRCFVCTMRGENNPRWQGGKSFEPYPLGWTKTHREQIRYRDEYKCRLCGVPEAESNRKLSVHHIDYDKKNINENNLISLCLRCHLKTNTKRNNWTNYFKEKTDVIFAIN